MDFCVQIYGSRNAAGILYLMKQELGGAYAQLFAGDVYGGQAVHEGVHGWNTVKPAHHNIPGSVEPQLRKCLDERLCQYVIGTEKSWGRRSIFCRFAVIQPS